MSKWNIVLVLMILCPAVCLRLVIEPVNSRNWEKNYNGAGIVADESGKDARTVTVTLYHDARYPTALDLPIAAKTDLAR